MLKGNSFQGSFVPTFAPFDNKGNVNVEVIPDYANYLHKNGVKGVFINGTVGEGMSMTVNERKVLHQAWVEACRGRKGEGRGEGTRGEEDKVMEVIAMVGAGSLKDSKDLASHAESAAVSAIACFPNLFDKPLSVAELIDYCQDVASSAPNTPFLYYHFPDKTSVRLAMHEFLTRGLSRIPTLAGIKFTSDDVTEASKCSTLKQFRIYAGYDHTLSTTLLLGLDSSIHASGNLFPQLLQEMHDTNSQAYTESQAKFQNLTQLQSKLDGLLKDIFACTNGFSISAMKIALNLLRDIDVGNVRGALGKGGLTPPQMETLRKVIDAIKQKEN